MNAKRKKISPQDVLEAMKEMEFERFVEKLKQCLDGESFSDSFFLLFPFFFKHRLITAVDHDCSCSITRGF